MSYAIPVLPTGRGMVSVLDAPPPGMRTVEDVRAQIAREGLDPRLLVVPPPLAVDSDLAADARQKIEDLTLDSLSHPGTRQAESRETQLVRSFFVHHGSFIPDILESYNMFIRNYAPKHQITVRNTNIRAVFGRVRFTRPTVVVDGKVVPLYPQSARSVHSYMSHIFADLQKYTIGEDKSWTAVGDPVLNVQIGSIPVMVRSVLCRTYGLSRDELLSIGEDPVDPGGYFISRGAEKCIPLNDSLREGRYIFMNIGDDMGPECRTTTRANAFKKSIVTQLHDYRGMLRVFYTHYPSAAASGLRSTMSKKDQLSRRLNALQIFRIFGVEDDPQTIVRRYVLRFVQPHLRSAVEGRLASTIHNMVSQGDYMTFVITSFEDVRDGRGIVPGDGIENIRRIFVKNLRDCFLSQMATDPDEARLLAYGMMIAHYVEYLAGYRHSDDRNDYGLKRLIDPAERLERLLLKGTQRLISAVETDVDRASEASKKDITYIARRLNGKTLGDMFDAAFSTSAWGVSKDPRPEENVTEALDRSSHAGVLSQLTKISAQTSSNNKDLAVRSVQPSQFNYVCPSDTPERTRVGIVKHRAIGCITSMDRSEVFLEILVRPHISKSYQDIGTSLMMNGRYMGTVDGRALYSKLLAMRRNGTLDYDTMLVLDEKDNILYLHNDHSRPIAPLLIINSETENLVIEEKNLWGKPFAELLANGAVEYIDAFEQSSIKLATDYNMLAMTKTVSHNLLAEHSRLKELKASIEAGEAPDTKDNVLAAETDVTDMREKLVRLLARVEETAAEKKAHMEDDIGPHEIVRLQQRTAAINRLKVVENEARVAYGRAKNELERRERTIISLKTAGTLAVVNDELRTLEGRLAKEGTRRRYTHCMMSPDTLFSFAASIIPAAGMQLATRVSYHCSKGVHSLGIFSGMYPIRMDTASKVQTWPSRPIFSSHMVDILGIGDMPQGETALVAVMPWGGYNQEDAIIMSKGAADRGLFAHTIYHIETCTLLKGDNYIESFSAPPSREGVNAHIFAGIGDDGLPIMGHMLKDGQAYACKVRKTSGDPKPMYFPEKIGFTHEGMVERLIVGVNHDGHTFARIKIKQSSMAIVGSKLVMRVAMKATISRIVPNEEMPYMVAKDGTHMVPDLILNPHSVPSRMSIGLLVEILLSKVAAMTAKDIDATSFRKLDMDSAIAYLKAHGMNPYGLETFFHPVTHKPLETLVFAGFAYTAILPAIPGLKIQARNKGARRLLTRQPSRGSDPSQSTGMRIGTQERDALISHGASELLRERLCVASDEYTDLCCVTCGRGATSNINTGNVWCPHCEDKARFGRMSGPFAMHTLGQLLEGGGLSIRYGFETPEQMKKRIAEGGEQPAMVETADPGAGPDVEEADEVDDEEIEEEVDEETVAGLDDFDELQKLGLGSDGMRRAERAEESDQ